MRQQPLRILLIEDRPEDAEIVRRACGNFKTPIDLLHVSTLSEGLVEVESGVYDLVISDLSLPDSIASRTISDLRRASQTAPIVVLTSNDDQDNAFRLLDQGAQDYLVKGDFDTDSLERSVRYAIQRQQNIVENTRLIYELKESHDLLKQKNRKLTKLYNTAQQFVDNVSHEFRTPLTVVKEYVSLIRDGLVGEVSDEQCRMLSIVEDRADDLNTMVDDMLDVSKLEAGMLGAWRKSCRVDEIFDHVTSLLERKALIKNVDLVYQIDEDLPDVYCDAEKAGRVILNLAINAIKFCGEPGVVIIAAHADHDANEVCFSVHDNGPGIDNEAIEAIFERFQQLESEVRGSCKGFGLGLSIAKRLVDLNLGQLHVESEIGKGSTFSFSVPLDDPIEVMQRQLQHFECQDETLPIVSVVQATLPESTIATVSDDMNAFLNYLLRRNDLLFRVASNTWMLALPMSELELGEYFEQGVASLADANRNRPFEPLPNIQFKAVGSWRVASHRETILETIEQVIFENRMPSEPAQVAVRATPNTSAIGTQNSKLNRIERVECV